MQGRGLMIAAGMLAALAGGVWYSNKLEGEKLSKPPADAPPKLVDIPQDQFKKIEIAKAGAEPLVLEQNASGKWTMTAPKSLPVDTDAVASLVSTLGSFSSDKLVEEKPSDLAQFGLAQPPIAVTITKKDGKTSKLLVGDEAPAGGGFYAKTAVDPRVFTVQSYNHSSIDKSWTDFRDKRLLTFDSEKLTRVELTAKKQSLEFGKNASNDWQILKPQPYRADNLQVEEIVRKLKDAKMDTALPEDEAAKAAGLFAAGTPVASARISDASGVQSIEIRKSKDSYYAKSSAVEGVWKVANELAEGLDKNLDDLRNKKLFDFGFADPGKVEIRDGEKLTTITRTGDDWMRLGKKLDPPGVQTLIDKLREISSIKFLTSGFTTPVVEITVLSNEGKRTEKVEIAHSGNSWIARRAGEPALYELDGKAVQEIQRALLDVREAPPASKK